MAPTLTVTEHGVSGKGDIDDRPAIQRLFDAHSNAGYVFVFPKGRYRLDSETKSGAILVPGRRSTLRLDPSAVLIANTQSSGGDTAIYIESAWVNIEGGRLVTTSPRASARESTGINLENGASNTTISGMTIHGFGSYAIHVSNNAAGPQSNRIANCRITGSYMGVAVDDADWLEVDNCQFFGNQWAINVEPNFNTPTKRAVGIMIRRCQFEGSTKYGVLVQRMGTTNVKILACSFRECLAPCIALKDGCKRITIEDCILYSEANTGEGNCLDVSRGGVSKVWVRYNTMLSALHDSVAVELDTDIPTDRVQYGSKNRQVHMIGNRVRGVIRILRSEVNTASNVLSSHPNRLDHSSGLDEGNILTGE